jgi:cytoskeletal protein RodZ
MKNITIDADNLLIILSFALLIAIFFNLLFGCTYTKPREYFNNKPEDKNEESDKKEESDKEIESEETKKSSSTPSTPPSKPPSTSASTTSEPPVKLSKFEQEIKEGLEKGTLKADDIMELVKAEKFTQVNVKNIMKDIANRIS